jgi:hypothetical protein
MTNSIAVPESFRAYLHHSTVNTAVNNLLEQKLNKIPPNLDWNSIRDYHEALFSATRVRRDYTIMLFDLMESVCLKAAEKEKKTTILPWDAWDSTEWPSPYNIWEDGLYYFIKVSKQSSDYIGFYLCVPNEGIINISVCTNIEGRYLGATDWIFGSDEWWKLADSFCPNLKKDSEINIVPLREKVEQILVQLLAGHCEA